MHQTVFTEVFCAGRNLAAQVLTQIGALHRVILRRCDVLIGAGFGQANEMFKHEILI
jgi:hypothetical protein